MPRAAVACAGVERAVLRETLAATLVKDHADRPTFDDVFDRYFALPTRAARERKRRGERRARARAPARGGPGAGRASEPEGETAPGDAGTSASSARAPARSDAAAAPRAELAQRRRALLATPFRVMDPREVEALRDLVAELSRRLRVRWSRRVAARGSAAASTCAARIRRALSRGGVPIELLLRAAAPGQGRPGRARRSVVLDRHRRRVPARACWRRRAASSAA